MTRATCAKVVHSGPATGTVIVPDPWMWNDPSQEEFPATTRQADQLYSAFRAFQNELRCQLLARSHLRGEPQPSLVAYHRAGAEAQYDPPQELHGEGHAGLIHQPFRSR